MVLCRSQSAAPGRTEGARLPEAHVAGDGESPAENYRSESANAPVVIGRSAWAQLSGMPGVGCVGVESMGSTHAPAALPHERALTGPRELVRLHPPRRCTVGPFTVGGEMMANREALRCCGGNATSPVSAQSGLLADRKWKPSIGIRQRTTRRASLTGLEYRQLSSGGVRPAAVSRETSMSGRQRTPGCGSARSVVLGLGTPH